MAQVTEEYITGHLSQALEKGYVKPAFQPIFRSVTGQITCCEALARWYDPEYGMLSPADFIPALENNGLIIDLDMYILRKTCEFYKELEKRGTPLHSFSVNLSRFDFKDADLYKKVTDTLAEFDVPHEAIKLEIIESSMLEDIATFQKVFDQFSSAGFSIWIDDFGSGYSSLNMLQNYDFDVMKLDMLFLRNFNAKGKKVLASLINMAKSLGIHTLAEGVETEEQKEFLMKAGCEAQQGFLLTKPLLGNEFIALVDAKPELLETIENKYYWNQIGYFNFLSANPLNEFPAEGKQDAVKEEDSNKIGLPVALLECEETRMKNIYVSDSFKKCLGELGINYVEELDFLINEHRDDQYLMLKKLVVDAIETGDIQRYEYIKNNVYYRLSARLLARKTDRAMLALRLSTFDPEHEVEAERDMINYSSALFSTYEIAVLIYPEKDTSKRIYASRNLPQYDQEKTIKLIFKKFVEAHVEPVDQARYLSFVDFSTIEDRMSGHGFIQGVFRLHWGNDPSIWHTVRLTRLPIDSEKAYILTIQTIHGNGMRFIDASAQARPELLE